MSQVASSRKSPKPGFVTSAVTTALGDSPCFFSTSKPVVCPAFTPPTRKSPPFVSPKALSKTMR